MAPSVHSGSDHIHLGLSAWHSGTTTYHQFRARRSGAGDGVQRMMMPVRASSLHHCFFFGGRRTIEGIHDSRRISEVPPGVIHRFQHVSYCLIYSAVCLFQFLRHLALLLKTPSALPAHHCMHTTTLSTASGRRGWVASHSLYLPKLRSMGERGETLDDQAGQSSHGSCIAHRLRVMLYSSR